jgi:serine protease Do
VGFAIPSNMLKEIGNSLIKTGRIVRPYIGVRIETLSDDSLAGSGSPTANSGSNSGNGRLDPSLPGGMKKGVVVRTIEPDTPAYKSDLKPADVITEVDGQPVNSDRELQKRILAKKVGDTVQLTVIRKGKTVKVPVVTGELPSEVAGTGGRRNVLPQPDSSSSGGGGGNEPGAGKDGGARAGTNNFYGLQVQKMTKDLAESMGVESDTGVIITSVAEDSPAARAGIQVRDVITEIGDKPVTDVESLKEALKGADPKRGIDCYVTRGGSKTFVVIKGS